MYQYASVFSKKIARVGLYIAMVCLAVLTSSLMFAAVASAKTVAASSTHAVEPQGKTSYYGFILDKSLQGARNLTATSNNTRVVANVKVEKSELGSTKGKWELVYENPGVTGKARVVVKGVKKGKRVTEKFSIKFIKYTNPAASFKFGGKDYAKAFNKRTTIDPDFGVAATVKKKIAIKAKKGWKLQSINLDVFDGLHKRQPKRSTVKNGSIVTLSAQSYLYAGFLNTKTNVYESLGISYSPSSPNSVIG